jgi:hypothetical protein
MKTRNNLLIPQKRNTMKPIQRLISATLSIAAAGIMCVPSASACGPSTDPSALQKSFVFQPLLPDARNPMSLATPADLTRDLNNQSNANSTSIIGMWKFQFISSGNPSMPDGAMLDFGYSQWHSDGTEVLNSGGRSPAQGNFCLGVWEKTNRSTYQLNHFALNYDPVTGNWLGKLGVVETVTLSPGGTRYSGTFVYSIFDTAGNKTSQLTGQVVAERVTVDTATP